MWVYPAPIICSGTGSQVLRIATFVTGFRIYNYSLLFPPSTPSLPSSIGYLWTILGGATQGDPVDGSFCLLGRIHLILSFFQILRSSCMGVIEPCLLPRWDVHLFEHWPRLHRLLALGSCMPILLAILAGKDLRSSLALSWEGAAGSVVIRTPTVVAKSGWPHEIPLLHSGSWSAGLHDPISLRRSFEGRGGPSPAICKLDLVNCCLFILFFLFILLPPLAVCI